MRSEPAFHPDDVADKMDEPVMPPAPSAQTAPRRFRGLKTSVLWGASRPSIRRPVLAVAT